MSITEKLKYYESIRLDNERVLWAALSILGRPDGFLDVGCGDGWIVRTAFSAAIKPSIGVESDSEICASSALGAKILTRKLDLPFRIGGYFELVFALHTSKDDKIDLNGLGENLVNHTDKWLICQSPYPEVVQRKLKFSEVLTQRLQCAVISELGVFSK